MMMILNSLRRCRTQIAMVRAIAIVLVSLFCDAAADAQVLPTIYGVVTDVEQKPVTSAVVTLFSNDGATIADARTNGDGSFQLRVADGDYVARVSIDRIPVADARVQAPSASPIRITVGEFTAQPIPPPAETRAGNTGESQTQEVRVFYATDRERSPVPGTRGYSYTASRSAASDPLSFGSCLVSVPRDKRVGQLEAASLFRFDFRGSADGVMISKVTLQDEATFLRDVSTRATVGGRKVLVFVHGYNTAFSDACRRSGQLAYDLGFSGAQVVYSWPSRGGKAEYLADEESIQWTVPHLKHFLEKLATETGASIQVLAHSMGSRAVVQALAQSVSMKAGSIRDVIFAAPDLDSDVFMQNLASMTSKAKRITLYASSGDKALAASRVIHGNTVRAGESGNRLLVAVGLDTVDASTVDTDFLGHSYFGDSSTVLRDLFELIRFNAAPDDRFALARIEEPKRPRPYWQFRR